MSTHSESGTSAARPKRRPAYLQDYEVDFQRPRRSVPPVSQRNQAVESTDDNFPTHSLASAAQVERVEGPLFPLIPPSLVAREECYDNTHISQRYTPNLSQLSSFPDRNQQPQADANAEFVHLGERDEHQSDHSDASSVKMQRILEENSKLRETQQAIQADLKRIESTNNELIQLLERACNLQRPSATPNVQLTHPSVASHQGAVACDEVWPEPPPPVTYEESRYTRPQERSDLYNSKQRLIMDTRAPPTLTSQLKLAERPMDFNPPSRYEDQQRYDPYPVPQTSSKYVQDQSWDISKHPHLRHSRMMSHSMSPAIAPMDLTERYYKGPSPSIPYFRNKDPSEFARLKMALDNLLPPESTEMFKYQVLVDHLKLDDACLIADSYLHSPTPYRDTMMALNERFGQPHQVALKRIATILDSPDISRNDPSAFEKFSLQVQSLVGLLKTLGREGSIELLCGSHVARLLSKLPPERRADFRRHMLYQPGTTYSLIDLADWLKHESLCQGYDEQTMRKDSRPKPEFRTAPRLRRTSATVLTGSGNSLETYPDVKVDDNKAKMTAKELIGSGHRTWTELLEAIARELHGAAGESGEPTADTYQAAETYILQTVQKESFPEELQRLKMGKDLPHNSRLLTLAPEYDEVTDLIRVGGRLRRAETLDPATKHPVVLDAKHPAVKLLLQDYDKRLCHSGPNRVFAEVRRQFWVLRGREVIRSLQHACMECQRLRAKPSVPKMADLPLARLRLYKPAFYSTGVDCFGPFLVKIGR
ncbi:hypothetical protein QQF64_002650 [Cirrhinus molitorella]|uniref:Integrase zinc-binding domain-containing protein n=1 Tax=Cirrhinus molitorella TaxID=172907 RepID=A0ABR3MQT8_9TELE